MTVILAAAVWFSAKTAPGFFALEKQAAEYCTNYLEAIAVIVIILSLYVPLFGVFQGTRHVLVPAFTALFALTVRVTVTYLFKDSGFFGHRIIWWNGVFGFCVGCIICWVYYLSGRWQRNAAGTEQ